MFAYDAVKDRGVTEYFYKNQKCHLAAPSYHSPQHVQVTYLHAPPFPSHEWCTLFVQLPLFRNKQTFPCCHQHGTSPLTKSSLHRFSIFCPVALVLWPFLYLLLLVQLPVKISPTHQPYAQERWHTWQKVTCHPQTSNNGLPPSPKFDPV